MIGGVSKARYVVHGKGPACVEASVDVLAHEDEAQHTVRLADPERGRRCFEKEGIGGEEVGWDLESDVAGELALEMRAYGVGIS
jgi:hypothetical protein